MATAADPLAALRPLHLPPAPPGTLVETAALAAAAGVAAALLVVGLVALWRRLAVLRAPRREALAALAEAARLPVDERLAAEARLLRAYVGRIAGAAAARTEGRAWLARLDGVFATTFFTTGGGEAFGERLYRPVGDVDAAATDAGLRRLLRRQRR